MKYLQVILLVLVVTSCSSELIVVSRDSELDSMFFHDESIIICPSTGKWEFAGKDSSFLALPEASFYMNAFSKTLNELRPCLTIVDPAKIQTGFPGLEISMNRRKYCYTNMEDQDTSFFNYLEKHFNAQYFIFFESIEFQFNNLRTLQGLEVESREAKIILQLWDLKQKRMVYRALSKGNSSDIVSIMSGNNDQSSIDALENTFIEYIESLPECMQKY